MKLNQQRSQQSKICCDLNQQSLKRKKDENQYRVIIPLSNQDMKNYQKQNSRKQ